MHVAIQTYGGPNTGIGHLVRSAIIGSQLLKRGHTVSYITPSPSITRQRAPEGAAIVPREHDVRRQLRPVGGEKTIRLMQRIDADFLLIDPGHIPLEKQRVYHHAPFEFGLVFDENGDPVLADLVINGHLYADKTTAVCPASEPHWCLGGEYYVMPNDFEPFVEKTAPWVAPPEQAVIIMGGSDVPNATPTVIKAFDGLDLSVTVIIGPGFTNREEIKATAKSVECQFELVEDPQSLAPLLFATDLAVSAFGLTAYELLATGTPFVGFPVTDDQLPKADYFDRNDLAIVLNYQRHCLNQEEIKQGVRRLYSDDTLRRQLRERGRGVFSSDGAIRICDAIETVANG